VRALERRYHRRVESIEAGSFNLVRAQTIWQAARIIVRVVGTAILISGGFAYLRFVLGLYPWTRGFSERLLATVLAEVGDVAITLLLAIPNLAIVAIVVLAARYALRLAHRFFDAVQRGQIRLGEFDPEWATPTLRIVQGLIVALAAVIAYPYVPGSKSAAFQGISIFVGVLLSLGSSSLIANLIAGYTMAYRRAFRVGDRIAIGGTIGDVTDVRLMETHLRSVKNEELTIPNSMILNGEVKNFSSLARERGLILHTTIGIGYETPWRQVEAMLLMAAARVPELMRVPAPFVLHKALGDFCVTYELNVHCDRPREMYPLYSKLHRAILDVFNEYGVQIMTPAYEADPPLPKIVPRETWFAAPAAPPAAAKPAQAAPSPAAPA
jgi:small-conductance mechanosensitive channel